MLQDQPAPASGRNDKTVDTSGLSAESAISNEENLSGSGILSCTSLYGYPA